MVRALKDTVCQEVNRRPGVNLVGTFTPNDIHGSYEYRYDNEALLACKECSLARRVYTVTPLPLPHLVQASLKEHFCGILQPAALVDLLRVSWQQREREYMHVSVCV